jgi:hypothetical protein
MITIKLEVKMAHDNTIIKCSKCDNPVPKESGWILKDFTQEIFICNTCVQKGVTNENSSSDS